MITVALYGAGQLATGLAARLARRDDIEVVGPSRAAEQLDGGSDVVIIATTTRLADVAADVERAVAAGSNVIVSAEESAFPWIVDRPTAERIHTLAYDRGVTVVGGGLNPGFLFDAFVLTLLGAHAEPELIHIRRVVDLSRFGDAVRGRLGLGFTVDQFTAGRERGDILGHAGFAQSMRIVGDAIGRPIDEVAAEFAPDFDESGLTSGFRQTYSASSADSIWFVAEFVGNVDLPAAGLVPLDTVTITDEFGTRTATIDPGVPSQEGSVSIIANSIDRVMAAPRGWITVAALPPAYPRVTGASATGAPTTGAPTTRKSAQ